MRTEPSDSLPLEGDTLIEHAVIHVLLASDHVTWSRAELTREISGPTGHVADVADAIAHLYGAGLVNVTGDLVTATLAARRMDELRL